MGGTQILERSSQGSRPTKTGERLVGSSTELLDAIERAQLEFAIVRGAGAVRASRGVELKPLYTERTAINAAPRIRLQALSALPLLLWQTKSGFSRSSKPGPGSSSTTSGANIV